MQANPVQRGLSKRGLASVLETKERSLDRNADPGGSAPTASRQSWRVPICVVAKLGSRAAAHEAERKSDVRASRRPEG